MKVNKKMLSVFVLGVLLIGCVGIISYNHTQGGVDNMEEVYQGPVPQGYDLEHFRETGQTIKIKEGPE